MSRCGKVSHRWSAGQAHERWLFPCEMKSDLLGMIFFGWMLLFQDGFRSQFTSSQCLVVGDCSIMVNV